MRGYVQRLNRIYRKYRALYEIEDSWDGFEWMNVDDHENSALAFLRNSKPWRGKRQQILCALNFTPVVREHYKVALPQKGTLRCILNSDDIIFGGSGVSCGGPEIKADGGAFWGRDASVEITLPPLSAVYFEYIPDRETENDTIEKNTKIKKNKIKKSK